MRAFVRSVSDSLANCLLTYMPRQPIDVSRARAQHAAYTSLLEDLGCHLMWLPELHDAPDAVFVEDTAVIAPPVAVLTRPGADARRVETASVGAALAAAGPVAELTSGQLDGGDVLRVGRRLYVGMTQRTDPAGAAALAAAVKPHHYDVLPVDVTGVLHLKTAVTPLPDGTLVAAVDHIDPDAFGSAVILPAPEPAGADVLTVGDVVLVSAAAPGTATMIRRRGWDVRTIDISELERAEAGVTCMSIIDDR